MTIRQVIPLHGSSHRPQGADPIPGLGDYLHWGENVDDNSLGLIFNTSESVSVLAGFDFIVDVGRDVDIEGDGDASFRAMTGGLGLDLFDSTGVKLSSGGRHIQIECGGTTGEIELRIGTSPSTFTVADNGGNPLLQMTAGSPDLHIPTGGTVIADL